MKRKVMVVVMPRRARKKSSTGIYHAMIRGINKQKIFFTEKDYGVFLKYLKESKEKNQVKVLAYCIMPNHVHILLKENPGSISDAMKSINIRYSQYFNKKMQRVGHVFQNRFQSQCVENLSYLANVIEYIHENPAKAGISLSDRYRWSSCRSYKEKKGFADYEYVFRCFHENIQEGEKIWKEYVQKNRILYQFADVEDLYTVEQILILLKKSYQIESLEDIKKYHHEQRNRIINMLYREMNLSVKYIKELTGMSVDIIRRVIRENREF